MCWSPADQQNPPPSWSASAGCAIELWTPARSSYWSFSPIFPVGSLSVATRIVEQAARPNGAILVDTLHLARSGGRPPDLREVPRPRLPYLQIADAPRETPPTIEGLRDEALHGRLLPGAGTLPLAQTLEEVPGVPLSFELRSAALMAAYPNPLDRATTVLAAQRLVQEAARPTPG